MSAINNIQNAKTRAFAEACYENSLGELRAAGQADPVDMAEWGITAEQWAQAVNAAIEDQLED